MVAYLLLILLSDISFAREIKAPLVLSIQKDFRLRNSDSDLFIKGGQIHNKKTFLGFLGGDRVPDTNTVSRDVSGLFAKLGDLSGISIVRNEFCVLTPEKNFRENCDVQDWVYPEGLRLVLQSVETNPRSKNESILTFKTEGLTHPYCDNIAHRQSVLKNQPSPSQDREHTLTLTCRSKKGEELESLGRILASGSTQSLSFFSISTTDNSETQNRIVNTGLSRPNIKSTTHSKEVPAKTIKGQ